MYRRRLLSLFLVWGMVVGIFYAKNRVAYGEDNKQSLQWEQKINAWMSHLKAHTGLSKLLERKAYDKLAWYYVDLNQDGDNDIIAHVRSRSTAKCSLWAMQWNKRLAQWELVWSYSHDSLCQDSTTVLAYDSGEVGLCETWSVGQWVNEGCSRFHFDPLWRAFTTYDLNRLTDTKTWSYSEKQFNFLDRTGRRAYTHFSQSSAKPIQHHSAHYGFLLSQWKGANKTWGVNATFKQAEYFTLPTFVIASNAMTTHSYSKYSKPSMEIQTFWNDSGVWLDVVVKGTDVKVKHKECSEDRPLYHSDHLSFWFDLQPSLSMQEEEKEDWEYDYFHNYANNPNRHEMDKLIKAVSFIPIADCLQPLHLADESTDTKGVVIKSTALERGYLVEAFFPAAFFHVKKMGHFKKEGKTLGFSLVLHDIQQKADEEKALFQSLASSQWQWGNAYSFGELVLLPKDASELPPFPLCWDCWLGYGTKAKEP